MSAYETPRFSPVGDCALVVEFGDSISPSINARVHGVIAALSNANIAGVTETVPTYRSALVHYDPMQTTFDDLMAQIGDLAVDLSTPDSAKSRVIEIPTLYGDKFGPDISFVAQNAGMTESEIIDRHSAIDYLVYAMGFSPGFPYLGGLDAALHTPRLASPRTVTPAGSVGIAETQTGVYPVASPGGWRIIGRTPLQLFDPHADPPALLDAGDLVRFVPIEDEAAYRHIELDVRSGSCSVAKKDAAI